MQALSRDTADTFGVKRVDGSASPTHQLYSHAKLGAADVVETVKDGAREAHDTVREFVESRPVTVALGALALGWFMGRMARY